MIAINEAEFSVFDGVARGHAPLYGKTTTNWLATCETE